MMALYEKMAADGEPAPGPKWNIATVKRLLKNELYTGDFTWGEQNTGKYNRATEEPIFIPNNHPSIIDRTTFDPSSDAERGSAGGRLHGATAAPLSSPAWSDVNVMVGRCTAIP